MNPTNGETIALCPDCEQDIMLGLEPEAGENITCPNCWASLIVVDTDPIQLAWDTVEEADDDGM